MRIATLYCTITVFYQNRLVAKLEVGSINSKMWLFSFGHIVFLFGIFCLRLS